MKVFEYAREHGITSTKAKEKFGLPSHLSVIPEQALQAPSQPAEEPPVVEPTTEPIEDVPPLDVIELSIRCLGGKSPQWKYRHLIGR